MSDTLIDLAGLEKLMGLMRDYEVDEVTWQDFTVKKSRHRPATIVVPAEDNVTLAQHLAPSPNEPWNAVPQGEVDEWAVKGRT